jgi:hypothetical protein
MMGGIMFPNRNRPVHKHKEAFHLMNYRCKCGHHERIWNSRDGVTPFTLSCPRCKQGMGLVHVDWQLDIYNPFYIVPKGSRYFADMTLQRARELAARNVDFYISEGRIPESQRNRKIELLRDDYYAEGNSPDILVKE